MVSLHLTPIMTPRYDSTCTSGKYVGSRPVKISKAQTQVGAVDIGAKKARELEKNLKNKRGVGRHRGFGVLPNHVGHKPYVRR